MMQGGYSCSGRRRLLSLPDSVCLTGRRYLTPASQLSSILDPHNGILVWEL